MNQLKKLESCDYFFLMTHCTNKLFIAIVATTFSDINHVKNLGKQVLHEAQDKSQQLNKALIERYYNIPWELLKITIDGKTAFKINKLDVHTVHDAEEYILKHYGYDLRKEDDANEVVEIHQKAIEFIEKYFLTEEINPNNAQIPIDIREPDDIRALLMIASNSSLNRKQKWSCAVLRVMNVIAHIYNTRPYENFSTIRQQIYDRFNEYIYIDRNSLVFFGKGNFKIPLQCITVKMEKTLDSTIMKLLNRANITVREIFDHLGVRIVTKRKCDVLPILEFIRINNIASFTNIHHQRSRNTLIDIDKVKNGFEQLFLEFQSSSINHEDFFGQLEHLDYDPAAQTTDYNIHTSDHYQAIHLTCLQLIQYPNPLYNKMDLIHQKISAIPSLNSQVREKLLTDLDLQSIPKVKRFFYPYEIQITDSHSHQTNTKGYASHQDYKMSQTIAAKNNALKDLLD